MKKGIIDWTENEVCLYIFEKKGSQYVLTDTISIPPGDELNQSSLSLLNKTNLEYIYLSVPVNALSLRELSFPFFDKNKIKNTINYELEGILLGDPDEYSIDHIVIDSSESGSKVLAVCMTKARLKEIINKFSSVGIEPKVITSIDLRLSDGKIERLLETPVLEKEIRAEAAKEEFVRPSINLRQEEMAYKGDIEGIKKTLRLTTGLVLILMIILGLNTTLKFQGLKKENSYLKKEIHALYRNAFPEDKKIVDAVRQFKGNFNMLMEKKDILGGIPVLDILRNIANLKDSTITLDELNIEEGNILIKGTATSFENVESFKNTLFSLFEDVKVMDSNASGDKRVSFTIVMKEKAI